jgi:prepilin-type N-terminal cleavage/methylation domain-containing protein
MSVRANGRRAPKCASGGFSIVELLVVVAIIAIMIGISIFSLPTAQRSLNVDFAVAQLVDVLRFASQRALAERQMMRVEISPSTDDDPGTIQVVDQNTLTAGVGDDAVIRTETLPLKRDATIDVGGSGLPIPPSPFNFLAAAPNRRGTFVFYFTPEGAMTNAAGDTPQSFSMIFFTPAGGGDPDPGLTRAVTLFGPTSAVRTWRLNPQTNQFEEM